jgi:hypothetical protein
MELRYQSIRAYQFIHSSRITKRHRIKFQGDTNVVVPRHFTRTAKRETGMRRDTMRW